MSAEFTVYFNVLANGTLVNNVSATSNLTNETNNTNNTTAYKPNMTVQKKLFISVIQPALKLLLPTLVTVTCLMLLLLMLTTVKV